jgi:uncharacterized protein with HEPN domain
MNEYYDILRRILKFISECEVEKTKLNDSDQALALMAYKSVALDLIEIGESVNRLRKKFGDKLDKYPDIPWDDIVGLRNILVHDYDGIIKEEIEEGLETNLNDLKDVISKMLDESA